MSRSFQDVLDQIRSMAESEFHKGRLFERLMKTYFREDPIYADRFSEVWLWSEWSRRTPGFDGADLGIDLVAEERAGGYCAIQCKCYAPKTRISKPHLDSFIAASARDPFTARIVVDTGDAWGPNALKTVKRLTPPCSVLRFGGLFDSPFDWPDLAEQEPEELAFRQLRFELKPHQQGAFRDITGGFETSDRGKLIMACGTGKTFVALRVAEHLAGVGGRILYLVPSISLLAQAMREWAFQKGVPHRYVGICSDTSAGRRTEDASFEEFDDWTFITPNRYHDRIAQRSEACAVLMSVGSKAAKAGKSDEAIFTLFSSGYKTGSEGINTILASDEARSNRRVGSTIPRSSTGNKEGIHHEKPNDRTCDPSRSRMRRRQRRTDYPHSSATGPNTRTSTTSTGPPWGSDWTQGFRNGPGLHRMVLELCTGCGWIRC